MIICILQLDLIIFFTIIKGNILKMKNTIKEKPYEGIWSKIEPYTIYKVDLEGRHTLSQTGYNMYKFLFKDI